MKVKSSMTNASLASRQRLPRGSQARITWLERALTSAIRILLEREDQMDRVRLLTALAVLEATQSNESNSKEDGNADETNAL